MSDSTDRKCLSCWRASRESLTGLVATSTWDCSSSYMRFGPSFLLAASMNGRDRRGLTEAVCRSTMKYSSSMPNLKSNMGLPRQSAVSSSVVIGLCGAAKCQQMLQGSGVLQRVCQTACTLEDGVQLPVRNNVERVLKRVPCFPIQRRTDIGRRTRNERTSRCNQDIAAHA